VVGVISRGGRTDLAGTALDQVMAPSLFIVGGNDGVVREMNEDVARRMESPVDIEIVPGATHLFEETGALEQVIDHALAALDRWLPAPPAERTL
jgi:putative phosphoribosyl transferase